MFFSFEGGDGVGKSTQIELLADWLRERGVEVVTTREPGGTELGLELRAAVLHGGHVSARDRGAAVRDRPRPPRGHRGPPGARARRRGAHRPVPGLLRRLPGRRARARCGGGRGAVPVGHRGAAAAPDGAARPRPGRSVWPGWLPSATPDRLERAGADFHGRTRRAFLDRRRPTPGRCVGSLDDAGRRSTSSPPRCARGSRRWWGWRRERVGRRGGAGGARWTVLRAAVADPGAMTHAWLITGPPGSGRSNAARAFAAALQCLDGGCGHCAACTTALAGTHADVTVVATEKVTISIEEVRDLIGVAQRSPSQGRWRVIVLEDADRMTERTSNVLLKAIEEPPPRTVWLLCSTSPQDVAGDHPVAVPVAGACGCRRSQAVARLLVERDGVDPVVAESAARAAQSHIGLAGRLARDPEVRERRRRTLELVGEIRGVGDAVLAAGELVEVAQAEAKAATEDRDAAEKAALLHTLGAARTVRDLPPTLRAQVRQLEDDQKRRATRAQRDVLDRTLLDLLSLYRDVLVVQLGAGVEPVNTEHAELVRRLADGVERGADPAPDGRDRPGPHPARGQRRAAAGHRGDGGGVATAGLTSGYREPVHVPSSRSRTALVAWGTAAALVLVGLRRAAGAADPPTAPRPRPRRRPRPRERPVGVGRRQPRVVLRAEPSPGRRAGTSSAPPCRRRWTGRTWRVGCDRARHQAPTGRRPVGQDRLAAHQPWRPGRLGHGLPALRRRTPSCGKGMLAAYDVVGFDPRGVGQSTAVSCGPDSAVDAVLTADDVITSQATLDAVVARQTHVRPAVPGPHRAAAGAHRHGQRGARHGPDARGARRRDAALPRLLLRHLPGRHLRRPVPVEGRPDGARRRARPDADQRRR